MRNPRPKNQIPASAQGGSTHGGSKDTGTSTMHISSNNSPVLLQTAQAFVCRPENQETGVNATVIFDSCSQRSYITSQTCEKLNLPVIVKETLLIKTFGDNSACVKECDVVQLCVRTTNGMSIYVTAYVVPIICSPVSINKSREQWNATTTGIRKTCCDHAGFSQDLSLSITRPK